MIQKRIEKEIDPYLQKTQYGFRRKKSTADAIHIVRRMLEVAYRSEVKLNMVLLDWEKAFDEILHESMHNALYRMNLPEKYLNIIREIYKKNPVQNRN